MALNASLYAALIKQTLLKMGKKIVKLNQH